MATNEPENLESAGANEVAALATPSVEKSAATPSVEKSAATPAEYDAKSNLHTTPAANIENHEGGVDEESLVPSSTRSTPNRKSKSFKKREIELEASMSEPVNVTQSVDRYAMKKVKTDNGFVLS
jgi:hypothetical protein